MLGLREVSAVAQVVIRVLFLVSLLDAASPAQTSLNDIHVMPRKAPTLANSISPPGMVEDSVLHKIKTDVKLVLVPVSVTDPEHRLITGLNAGNFQLYEGNTPQ